eukprot:g10271.t1
MTLRADFDSLWDFNDPAGTELKFRQLLPGEGDEDSGSDRHLELLTQIARAQGLQRAFDAAHGTLDDVEARLPSASRRVTIRYQLERGRVFNSSKQPERARRLFLDAWTTARTEAEDALAVDAAHMLAIIASPQEAADWNRQALELAESSSDSKARQWAGSLHNNIGWACHGEGNFATALDHFEKALESRIAQKKPGEIRVAKWCVARALRSLGRVDEALALQQQLAEECAADGKPDGYAISRV